MSKAATLKGHVFHFPKKITRSKIYNHVLRCTHRNTHCLADILYNCPTENCAPNQIEDTKEEDPQKLVYMVKKQLLKIHFLNFLGAQ